MEFPCYFPCYREKAARLYHEARRSPQSLARSKFSALTLGTPLVYCTGNAAIVTEEKTCVANMTAKTITISLAGQIDKSGELLEEQPEFRYEIDYLTLDLKSGQTFSPEHQSCRSVTDNSMLIALSESRLGAHTRERESGMAIEVVTEWIIKLAHRLPPHERLMRAVEEANYQVWRAATEGADQKVQSASLAVAIIEEKMAFVAQVGDVGAFIVRQGRIRRLPSQPSVEVISADSTLSEGEAEEEILLRLELGSDKSLKVGVAAIELQPNDYLLLCTDGLLNYLRLTDLLQLVVRNVTVANTCKLMIAQARQRGSEDHLGLALVQFGGDGLEIQPGANYLTNCFQYYSRTEPPPPAMGKTMELSSVKVEDLLPEAGSDGVHRTTFGAVVSDKDIKDFGRRNEIVTGFDGCMSALAAMEAKLSTQLADVKNAIDWLQSYGMMDGHLFASFVKLEQALKKITEARELTQESQKEFSATER